jgi:hypothetical protein
VVEAVNGKIKELLRRGGGYCLTYLLLKAQRLATTTDVYMQCLEEGGSIDGELDFDELNGTSTWGSKPSGTVWHNHASREQNDVTIAHDRETASRQKPVCGVSLEFATRLRQSRGREERLGNL